MVGAGGRWGRCFGGSGSACYLSVTSCTASLPKSTHILLPPGGEPVKARATDDRDAVRDQPGLPQYECVARQSQARAQSLTIIGA